MFIDMQMLDTHRTALSAVRLMTLALAVLNCNSKTGGVLKEKMKLFDNCSDKHQTINH